nr:LysR family transcriptional regulator [uncultured Devosia sp.]
MDTRHMRLFVALGDTLHFGRAAKRANMSQPPFSRQIASIEAALGVRLVERTSRTVQLTPAGERFYGDCKEVLERFDTACTNARLVASGMLGELRLGFMMHAAKSAIPNLVRTFTERRPHVRLILEETLPYHIDSMIAEGELDAAVTFSGPRNQALRSIPLMRDRLRAIARIDHPLLSESSVRPSMLDGEPLIAAPSTTAPTLRQAIEAFCWSEEVIPRFVFEPRLQQTIIQLVSAGLGIALVPETLCSDLPAGLGSVPLLEGPNLEVVLLIQTRSPNPALEELVDAARHLFGP